MLNFGMGRCRMKLGISDAGFRRLAQITSLRVFRGVGPAGAKELRASEDGMYGPGVYFYDHPYDARAYSSPGGGILYGHVSSDNAKIYGNVVLVENPEDVEIEGLIPNEVTSPAYAIDDWLKEDFQSLRGHNPLL